MPTATLKCRCGCKQRARRETMLVLGNAAFIDYTHRQAYMSKPKKAPKPKAKKRKSKSIARLRNDVAELLQKLVRMKAAIPEAGGMCQCVTCGKLDHWKNLQGGHFIERGKGATKILEENIHPQCPYCNRHGMKIASTVLAYRRYMVDMYGEKFVNELEILAKQTVKHTRYELEGMAFEFKRQIQEQEIRLSGRAAALDNSESLSKQEVA